MEHLNVNMVLKVLLAIKTTNDKNMEKLQTQHRAKTTYRHQIGNSDGKTGLALLFRIDYKPFCCFEVNNGLLVATGQSFYLRSTISRMWYDSWLKFSLN